MVSQHVRAGSGPLLAPGGDRRLMLTPQQWTSDQAAPTLDQMFPPAGFAMHHPVLIWLLLLELLGLLAFPLAFVLFGNLLDRGFVIAKTVGLLTVCYLVWIAVSLGVTNYDRTVIVLAVLALALAAAAASARLWPRLLSHLRARWKVMLAGEIVFLAAFAFFLVLRMWYPDLGHQFAPVSPTNLGSGRMGEKQMELAFLNAIARSRAFPPYDPFFAGGYINYYYYGFFLVATLCKLGEIAPATGFNLAIATFFALLAGNVFSVGLNLTRRVGPGLLAVLFVAVFGNLNGAWQLIRDLMAVAPLHSSIPLLGGLADLLSGLLQVLLGRQPLPPFDFWEPTRIVPPAGVTISEFPYFTYLFADLHPHLMAYPITVAALALAVNLALARRRRSAARPALLVTLLLGGLLLGALTATNPWDFPTYLGVVGLGALIAAYAARRRLTLRLLGYPLLSTGGLGALAVALYLPFETSYRTVFQTGIGLVRDVSPQSLIATGVAADQVRAVLVTPLSIYLEHFGFFVFAISSFLVLLLFKQAGLGERVRRWLLWLQFSAYYRERFWDAQRAGRAVRRRRRKRAPVDLAISSGVIIVVVGLVLARDDLLALLAALFGLVVLLLDRLAPRLARRQLFVLALLAVPLLLSIGTQIFYVKDFLAGGSAFRMNTIFKFYNQSWVLYGLCSAAALYYFMAEALRSNPLRAAAPVPRSREVPASGTGPVASRHYAAAGAGQAVAVAAHHVGEGPPLASADGSENGHRPSDAVPPLDTPAQHPYPHCLQRPLALFDRVPLWMSALLVLAAASLIYPFAGTVARETYRTTWLPESSVPLTLDGMAFMKVAYPGDDAGITWLNAHARGAQVIAEAPECGSCSYDWAGRVAMFTGLPDVQGGIHEGEQRYGDELIRGDDLNTLYSTPSISVAQDILRRYQIKYVFVGFVETHCTQEYGHVAICYPPSGIDKFRAMLGRGLAIAFRAPGVVIYRVTLS